MSVNELATTLQHIITRQPTAELHKAATLLEEARSRIAAVADGSQAPELFDTLATWKHASNTLLALQQACQQTQELLEHYLTHLDATTGPTGDPAEPTPPTPPSRAIPPSRTAPPTPPAATAPPPDPTLIAEVAGNGHKISAERVVRIGRNHEDRVIWLEEGNEGSGLQHLMNPKRIAQFEAQGVATADIADVVFTAVMSGKPIGIVGRDRVVYALTYRGHNIRVGVTVSETGYIVGANPVSVERKLKPLP